MGWPWPLTKWPMNNTETDMHALKRLGSPWDNIPKDL